MPVGWKEGAVALRGVPVVPFVPLVWLVEVSVAIGAMIAVLLRTVGENLPFSNLECRVMVGLQRGQVEEVKYWIAASHLNL